MAQWKLSFVSVLSPVLTSQLFSRILRLRLQRPNSVCYFIISMGDPNPRKESEDLVGEMIGRFTIGQYVAGGRFSR